MFGIFKSFEGRIEEIKDAKEQLKQDIADAQVGTHAQIEAMTQELARLQKLGIEAGKV